MIGSLGAIAGNALAATFTVNSVDDLHDANAGDGVCETVAGGGVCTLRAAIEEANALAGADTIELGSGTYLLTLSDTLNSAPAALIISDHLTIEGTGEGSAIIDGDGNAVDHRVFYLPAHVGDLPDGSDLVVTIKGLSIVHGFGPVDDNVDNGHGGGIANHAILTLDHVTIAHNQNSSAGGGIYNDGTLTLTNCQVVNNNSSVGGAGIFERGTLHVTESTFDSNTTETLVPSTVGGGAYLDSTATAVIRNSTFSQNHAPIGGGIYSHGSNSVVLINDTISGNYASTGGGLYVDGGSTQLYNVTVADNFANATYSGGYGAGIWNTAAGTVSAVNSIVAGNLTYVIQNVITQVNDDCAGTITASGYDIIQTVVAAHCTVNGSYSAVDPLLFPLELGGGHTAVQAIAPASPARDGGNPSGCVDNLAATLTTDQRGYVRPYGVACDIGAYEYGNLVFTDNFEP